MITWNNIRSFFGFESRALTSTDYPYLLGTPVHSGEYVSTDTALNASAVFACVRILSNTFASLPIHTFRRVGDSRERAVDHYLYDILKNKVNPNTTAFMWKQHLATSLLLHGNAYSQVIFNGRMQVTGLHPLNPARMTVTKVGNDLKYDYMTDSGVVTLPSDTVLHVRYLTTDGFTGISPLQAARQSVGISLAAEKHTAKVFSNGALFGSVIKIPGPLPDSEKALHLKQSTLADHQGAINSHKPLFLFGGASLEPLTINHNDLQFLELRKFSVAEIARIFGVPLHMLGEHETTTFGSVEAQSLGWLRDAIRPLVTNVEAELNTTLLSDRERQTTFTEFLLDDFLRSDIKSRYEAYGVALGTSVPFMTPNEVRQKENLPPIEGGDKLFIPRQNTPEAKA